MVVSSDKEATISDNDICRSEDGATKTQIPSMFDEGLNELELLMKELNVQAVKKIANEYPMFKGPLLGFELNASDIDTSV